MAIYTYNVLHQKRVTGRYRVACEVRNAQDEVLFEDIRFVVGDTPLDLESPGTFFDDKDAYIAELLDAQAMSLDDDERDLIVKRVTEEIEPTKFYLANYIKNNPTAVVDDMYTSIRNRHGWQVAELANRLVYDYCLRLVRSGNLAEMPANKALSYREVRDHILTLNNAQLDRFL